MPNAKPRQDRAPEQATDYESAIELLSSLGEVAYRWTIDDDRLHWDGDVQPVLGLPSEEIDSGRRYSALLDPANESSRHDAVFADEAADRGSGVPFRVEYAIRPGGPEGPLVWVEDFGRWYADGAGRPKRVVGVIRVVSDRHEREQRLTFRSSYDELTGFYNRIRLLEIIGETLAASKRLSVSSAFLLLTIDSFRSVNDAYGFEVGDQVIAKVAKRVASRLRGADAIGRFSGNKLGVVLREANEDTMAIAARRFLDAAREEVVMTDSGAIAVSVSIGGVVLPRNAGSVAEATARAEEALSQARHEGHGHFRAYVPSRAREAERRSNAAMSTELVHALGEDRLCIAFQPIVEIGTRTPAFYESLLRLRYRDGSIAEARSFMPLTQRLGMSQLLDRRALELTLRSLKENPGITLTVNATPDAASDPKWMETLEQAAADHPQLCKRLVVEITESTAIRNLEEAVRFVARVKRLGCRVAIDDFGAGYSSYRNLRELDIDIVKIDGRFIANLADDVDDQVFVKALVAITRHLKVKTVAEWIRDERSAALLAGWGVDYLQGDLIGAPSFTLAAAR